jgi:hypothetical protein
MTITPRLTRRRAEAYFDQLYTAIQDAAESAIGHEVPSVLKELTWEPLLGSEESLGEQTGRRTEPAVYPTARCIINRQEVYRQAPTMKLLTPLIVGAVLSILKADERVH